MSLLVTPGALLSAWCYPPRELSPGERLMVRSDCVSAVVGLNVRCA